MSEPSDQEVFPAEDPFRFARELEELKRNHDALVAQTARYAEDIRQMYQKERAVEAGWRQQLERIRGVLKGDALSMVFQPIVELADGRIVGFEALSRFAAEPRRSPDVWFAEAAAVGLLVDLELAALRAAFSHFDRLPPDAYLSVNLSPETVPSPQLADLLAGLPGERIVVEVTEHAPVDDYDTLNDALASLRALGCRLAIDDTGAGFASLRHILRLAPDIIKLDITLTRGLDSDRARRALATALISFANEIGATLVAEGVETQPEVDALRALGVGLGQGYFFARPGPLPPLNRG